MKTLLLLSIILTSSTATAQESTCGQYLKICEQSCQDRGRMSRFVCLGADGKAWKEVHYNCQCFDDLGLSQQ